MENKFKVLKKIHCTSFDTLNGYLKDGYYLKYGEEKISAYNSLKSIYQFYQDWYSHDIEVCQELVYVTRENMHFVEAVVFAAQKEAELNNLDLAQDVKIGYDNKVYSLNQLQDHNLEDQGIVNRAELLYITNWFVGWYE